jgi:hypothetical protein
LFKTWHFRLSFATNRIPLTDRFLLDRLIEISRVEELQFAVMSYIQYLELSSAAGFS